MPELPPNKVGIIACCGEEIPEGTVTRQAALKVLAELRKGSTATICLPLFLAGGEGDRAFARFYPTIAIDGCELRCAFHGTERYSNRPAASVVVSKLVADQGLPQPGGCQKLDAAGEQAAALTASWVADKVDELLAGQWNRVEGRFTDNPAGTAPTMLPDGGGLPVQEVFIEGRLETVIGLPFLFQLFRDGKKPAIETTIRELLLLVKVYNPIAPEREPAYREALLKAYQDYLETQPTSGEA